LLDQTTKIISSRVIEKSMTRTDPYDETNPYGKKRKRRTKKGLIPAFLSSVKRSINRTCKQQHDALWGTDKKKNRR
jgi:hypothetical protein